MDVDTNVSQSNHNRGSRVWDYMSKEKEEKARCFKCKALLSRQNGATSGLRKHLFQVHKIEAFRTVTGNLQTNSDEISTEEKKKIDSLVINCIIRDGRSFDDMRRPGILKLINHLVPTYTPPHRNTVQTRLKRLHCDKKSILIKQLSKINSIGVTCDFWSDKRLYSYLCLTGHYITSSNKFLSKVLAFSWFHHRHTSANICTIIKKELKELNILEKTRSITTDGAANMLKIGGSLTNDSKQIWCVAHRLHLVVCNGLGLWIRKKPASSSSTSISTTTSTTATSNLDPNDIDSDEEDYTDDVQVNLQLPVDNSSNLNPTSDESFDESNNLLNNNSNSNVVLNKNFVDEEQNGLFIDYIDNWSIDVIEELDPVIGELIQQNIGILMKKCRSMVKLMNKSSILMNYISNLKKEFGINLSLQMDCKSRWSSTQHLVEVMIIYKRIINKINSEKHDIGLNTKQTNKISSIELNQSDSKMLEILKVVLTPFVQVTNLISGSQYPTI
ncbi:unnamed protein product, partial [Adineta ricciae]